MSFKNKRDTVDSAAKKRKKRKKKSVHPSTSASSAPEKEQNVDGQEVEQLTPEQQEESDFNHLKLIAKFATEVTFDDTGRPTSDLEEIQGLIRTKVLPEKLQEKLKKIHSHVRNSVSQMVPWAGIGTDDLRVRGMGFVGSSAYERLVKSDIKLRAQEKTGVEAEYDEDANHEAVCIIAGGELELAREAANELLECIQPDASQKEFLHTDQLIAYQPNLHRGASHLVAHLDYPLHDGFGKVIVTVAIEANAIILLIGPAHPISGLQPAWKFHLQEGEAYVLSGKARNECLHAVIADPSGPHREGLNLRFGLHSSQEAYDEVLRHWPNED